MDAEAIAMLALVHSHYRLLSRMRRLGIILPSELIQAVRYLDSLTEFAPDDYELAEGVLLFVEDVVALVSNKTTPLVITRKEMDIPRPKRAGTFRFSPYGDDSIVIAL